MGLPIVAADRQISALVRSRRREAGMTQAQVAHQLGVSRKWISDIERGRAETAEFGSITRLLAFLGYRIYVDENPDGSTTTSQSSTTDRASEDAKNTIHSDSHHQDSKYTPGMTDSVNASADGWVAGRTAPKDANDQGANDRWQPSVHDLDLDAIIAGTIDDTV